MFCRNCGTELREGAAFCQNCGTPVTAQEPVQETPAAAPMQKTAEVTPAAVPMQEAKPDKKKEKSNGNKSAVIVLVVLILLIIGAGAGVAFYFTGDGYNIKKNMKLAQRCFEEKEYEDAIGYYDEALDLDDTLVDAYLNSADIYVLQDEYEAAIELLAKGRKRTRKIEESEALLTARLAEVYEKAADYYAGLGNYSQAYSLLRQGIEDTGEAALTEKLADVYLSDAEKYLREGNYDMARSTLKAGIAETGSDILASKQVEIYSRETEYYLSTEDYYSALWTLDDGINATGDTSLVAKKSEVYVQWADHYVSLGYYEDALWVLDQGVDATGDIILTDHKSDIYAGWAEAYKAAGDYTGALETLENGFNETGASSLAEQKKHLQENLKLAKATAYFNSRVVQETEYDEAGNVTKSLTYSYGSLDEGFEIVYGASGNQESRTVYSDGSLSYIMKYDENGNPRDQTWYDRYGVVTYYETAMIQYDEAGRVQWIIWSGEDESSTVQIQRIYDETGELLVTYRYGWDGSLMSAYEYQDGNVSKIITYSNDEIEEQTEYTYITSESGLVYVASEITYYGEESIKSWMKYEYEFDDMGNAVSETGYYGYDYNYDETMSNGYYDYQWTYKNEYRYTGQ